MPFLAVHLGGGHDLGVHHRAGGLVPLVHRKGFDANPAPPPLRVNGLPLAVMQRRRLAVALVAHHQQKLILRIVHHIHRHYPVVAPELHPDDPGRVPVAFRDAFHRAEQCLPLFRNQHHRGVFVRRAHRYQLVALLYLHRQQARLTQVLQLPRTQGVQPPLPRGENVQIVVIAPAHRQHRLHLLAGLQLYQIDQQRAPRRAAGVAGRLVHIQRIHPPPVGKKQQLPVRVRDGNLHHRVIVPVAGAAHPLAPPPLRAVGINRNPLDVAPLAQGHDHILLDNELLNGLLLHFIRFNPGAAGVVVLPLRLPRLPLDFGADFLRVL